MLWCIWLYNISNDNLFYPVSHNESPLSLRNSRSNRWLTSLVALMAMMSLEAQTTAEQPRLVVHILVDQLRTDYLEAFSPLYGEGGLKRLMRQGRYFPDARQAFKSVDRASATASMVTGTTPSDHGVIALKWLSRKTLQPVYCVDDPAYKGHQTTEASSPANLLTTSVADELEVATGQFAVTYGIAPDRDMAILMAGHVSDGAFWISDQTGSWCGTSYYGEYPAWASVYERMEPLSQRIGSLTWKPVVEGAHSDFHYFKSIAFAQKTDFSHTFTDASRIRQFKTSALVNEEVYNFVERCIEGSYLGRDNVPDLLSIGLYAGNYENKSVLLAPSELQDTYVRLDRVIADLLALFEHLSGKGRTLVVLSSTGYSDSYGGETDLKAYRLPSGTFSVERASMLLNMYLVPLYGKAQYVEGTSGNNIYLNHKLIEQKQLNLNEVLTRCEEFLGQMSGVRAAYTARSMALGAWDQKVSSIRASWHPERSGDILIEVSPGWQVTATDGSQSVHPGDAYEPYPVMVWGPEVVAAQVNTPVQATAVAPTLARCLRIRAPNASREAPLQLR